MHNRFVGAYNGSMDTIIYLYPLKEEQVSCQTQPSKKEWPNVQEHVIDGDRQREKEEAGKKKLLNRKKQQNKRKRSGEENASSDLQIQKSVALYCVKEQDMQDYHLVRVGVSKKLVEICGANQLQKGVDSKQASPSKERREGFWGRRCREKERKAKQRREEELLAEFLQQIWREPENSLFVCEEAFPFFNRWEFNGYFEADWVRHMLKYAGYKMAQGLLLPHFIILGQARCLTEVLYQIAGKMKSLKWILPVRQFREEQQELVEVIYEEYGLAVDLHLLEDEDAYRKVRISCALPSVVLDFSEADRVSTAGVARGSIWLDMAASEIKRRRIEDRNTGINYFSLKKEWKQPQKAINYLDTISKNGYNT